MKIGDKVRFLSEVGEGIVAGFKDKNIVLVEDSDGFQIPMSRSDIVVIGAEDYGTDRVVRQEKQPVEPSAAHHRIQNEADRVANSHLQDAEQQFPAHSLIEERRGGDHLSVYLAFLPADRRNFSTTAFETYLVNDSNYFLQYTYLSAENNSWKLRSKGEIEPNTKIFIEEFNHESIGEIERIAIQCLPYKKDKAFALKAAIDARVRIDTVKFYKLHAFRENMFFDEPALLYTVIENDEATSIPLLDAEEIKNSMLSKSDGSRNVLQSHAKREAKGSGNTGSKRGNSLELVVDLHADALLSDTAGMSSTDILNYQLDKFRSIMDENFKHKGQRIVFIHGKGEGVLRHALLHELNQKYKSCSYQDASFQEYGYGATLVTIGSLPVANNYRKRNKK